MAKSFEREVLLAAFSKVENKTNWKMPIKATIPKKDFELVADAISYFAGSPTYIVKETKTK